MEPATTAELTHLALTCRPGVRAAYSMTADLEALSHDEKLCAKIMRKRQEEMARRTRILNPRLRTGGIEHHILDAQVALKQASTSRDVEEDAHYNQVGILQDQILQSVEAMKMAAARERQKAVVQYSLQHLHKGQRREYELSDPNIVRNQRVPDEDDPELGPSSMQKWSSSGKDTKEYKRAVQMQQAAWLQQQIDEKKQKEQAEKEYDRYYDTQVNMAAHIRGLCEQAAEQEQREEKCAEAADNLKIAEEHRARREALKKKEFDSRVRHAASVKGSDLLSEAPDWKLGTNGRLQKGEYKRLTLEEEQGVYNTNARILLDKHAKKQADAAEEAHHTAVMELGVAVLGAVEVERAKQTKERMLKNAEENQAIINARVKNKHAERMAYLAFDY